MICLRNPDPTSSYKDTSAERLEEVQAVKEFLRAVGDVRSQAKEERGEDAEIPGLLVLVNEGQRQQQDRAVAAATADDSADGEGEDDHPFSDAWWEDQLFDDGLMGFEVISWDPTLGEEEKRNNLGGKYLVCGLRLFSSSAVY